MATTATFLPGTGM